MIFLVVLLLVIGISAMVYQLPITYPELKYLLVGEKVALGQLMYVQIWDNLSPFSAIFFGIMFKLFGKNLIAYHIIALLLIAIQLFLFVFITNKNEIFPSRNYLSGLFYLIGIFTFYEYLSLSPALLSVTFIYLSFHLLLQQFQRHMSDEHRLRCGFYIGIATLFYFPSCIFLVLVLFVLSAGTRLTGRSYILIILGFLLPIIVVGVFFTWHQAGYDWYYRSIMAWFYLSKNAYITMQNLLYLMLIPLSIIVISSLRLFGEHQNNIQNTCRTIMSIWIICVAVIYWIDREVSANSLVFLVPLIGYFGGYYFLVFKKKMVAEMIVWVIIITTLTLFFNDLSTKPLFERFNKATLNVVDENKSYHHEHVKVLIMGSGIFEYNNNSVATKYLNWQMAKEHFNNLDDFYIIAQIYSNIYQEMPDVIYDKDNFMPKLMLRIPQLKRDYLAMQNNTYFKITH